MSRSESRMYCKSPNIVFGFHGCSVDTFSKVIYEHQNLVASTNDYDSVRGVFTEGDKVYPDSAFREKNHIQLCIINPNCIKGYFVPQKENVNYKCV